MSSGTYVSEYIKQHLNHFSVGDGFWEIHVDTLILSWILGILFLLANFFNFQKRK
jgi:F-type H+-transporting ATPase subunit a